MLRNRNWILLGMLLTFCARTVMAQDKTLMVRPLADAPNFTKMALVIGVGQYEHAGILAPATENDARQFADLLRTQFKFPQNAITLLTDEPGTPDSQRPTYIHLRNALKTLLDGINEKTEVIIYFSGHGIRAEDHDWLVPLDYVPNDVKQTCINYDDFKSQLNTKAPSRALLIIDACRNLSGGKGAGSSGFGLGKGLEGPQFAELLSCQPKQESKVGKPEDFNESVFTHFLLQGLKGDPDALDNGVVTFDSLKLFVQGSVSQYVASKYGEAQKPDGRASLGKMVLSRGLKTKPDVPKTDQNPVAQQDIERPQQRLLGEKIVLFDGNNTDAWITMQGQPIDWKVFNGVLEVLPRAGRVGTKDVQTKEIFRDYQLHVEFNLANMPNSRGEDRSNSGVILNGQYEIQILDSVNNTTVFAGDCGSIWGLKPPDRQVCLPPGQWQSYDITFHSPQLDQDGNVIQKPRITLVWNGVKVHDNVQIDSPNYPPHPTQMVGSGPILLQDHGAPVMFRNIWLKRL